jgi:EAL domain-containing protein (putative c-di-GMP-specific phosphodiesterase class I)
MGLSRNAAEIRDILLLADDDRWCSAMTRAARELGTDRVRAATSARDALDRLVSCDNQFSHFVLHGPAAEDLLPAFLGLTAGEPGSGIHMIMVGEPASSAVRLLNMCVPMVAKPFDGSLGRAIAGPVAPCAPTKPLSPEELRDALATSAIALRYQPIVRMSDRGPRALEVLARLEHPVLGTIGADRFVPLMEEAGLAWPLTDAVVRGAFGEWGSAGLAEFGLPLALREIDERRQSAGMSAHQVVLELTESRPLEGVEVLRDAIARLRARGYGVAIDDIGPDKRSPCDHAALLDLDFTAVKLDAKIVRDAGTDPVAAAFLLRAVTDAHAAGRTVVAEGVESDDVWARMLACGVDEAQGFRIAPPLPAIAVAPWLSSWRGKHCATETTAVSAP